jgi:quinolinate synthase
MRTRDRSNRPIDPSAIPDKKAAVLYRSYISVEKDVKKEDLREQELVDRILSMKTEKNAVLLVHNYQRPELYDVADYIGDSFGLSKKAARTSSDIIVFCGVNFMAESAAILNPDKCVLTPTKTALCPMAAMIDSKSLIETKEKYPDAAVVCYVNTTAEVKAESDICCTSSNAVSVVNSIPEKRIIFVPDRNLAHYVGRHTDKEIIPWPGFCIVHESISKEQVLEAKRKHPLAKIVAHPECRPEVIDVADYISSTSGMLEYVKQTNADEFIVCTEMGMVNRLKREAPEKRYFTVCGPCIQMKKNTLYKTYVSLREEKHKVEVQEDIRIRAKKALDRMMEIP